MVSQQAALLLAAQNLQAGCVHLDTGWDCSQEIEGARLSARAAAEAAEMDPSNASVVSAAAQANTAYTNAVTAWCGDRSGGCGGPPYLNPDNYGTMVAYANSALAAGTLAVSLARTDLLKAQGS